MGFEHRLFALKHWHMFANIVDTKVDNESLNNHQVLTLNLASVSNQFDLTDSLCDVFTINHKPCHYYKPAQNLPLKSNEKIFSFRMSTSDRYKET